MLYHHFLQQFPSFRELWHAATNPTRKKTLEKDLRSQLSELVEETTVAGGVNEEQTSPEENGNDENYVEKSDAKRRKVDSKSKSSKADGSLENNKLLSASKKQEQQDKDTANHGTTSKKNVDDLTTKNNRRDSFLERVLKQSMSYRSKSSSRSNRTGSKKNFQNRPLHVQLSANALQTYGILFHGLAKMLNLKLQKAITAAEKAVQKFMKRGITVQKRKKKQAVVLDNSIAAWDAGSPILDADIQLDIPDQQLVSPGDNLEFFEQELFFRSQSMRLSEYGDSQLVSDVGLHKLNKTDDQISHLLKTVRTGKKTDKLGLTNGSKMMYDSPVLEDLVRSGAGASVPNKKNTSGAGISSGINQSGLLLQNNNDQSGFISHNGDLVEQHSGLQDGNISQNLDNMLHFSPHLFPPTSTGNKRMNNSHLGLLSRRGPGEKDIDDPSSGGADFESPELDGEGNPIGGNKWTEKKKKKKNKEDSNLDVSLDLIPDDDIGNIDAQDNNFFGINVDPQQVKLNSKSGLLNATDLAPTTGRDLNTTSGLFDNTTLNNSSSSNANDRSSHLQLNNNKSGNMNNSSVLNNNQSSILPPGHLSNSSLLLHDHKVLHHQSGLMNNMSGNNNFNTGAAGDQQDHLGVEGNNLNRSLMGKDTDLSMQDDLEFSMLLHDDANFIDPIDDEAYNGMNNFGSSGLVNSSASGMMLNGTNVSASAGALSGVVDKNNISTAMKSNLQLHETDDLMGIDNEDTNEKKNKNLSKSSSSSSLTFGGLENDLVHGKQKKQRKQKVPKQKPNYLKPKFVKVSDMLKNNFKGLASKFEFSLAGLLGIDSGSKNYGAENKDSTKAAGKKNTKRGNNNNSKELSAGNNLKIPKNLLLPAMNPLVDIFDTNDVQVELKLKNKQSKLCAKRNKNNKRAATTSNADDSNYLFGDPDVASGFPSAKRQKNLANSSVKKNDNEVSNRLLNNSSLNNKSGASSSGFFNQENFIAPSNNVSVVRSGLLNGNTSGSSSGLFNSSAFHFQDGTNNTSGGLFQDNMDLSAILPEGDEELSQMNGIMNDHSGLELFGMNGMDNQSGMENQHDKIFGDKNQFDFDQNDFGYHEDPNVDEELETGGDLNNTTGVDKSGILGKSNNNSTMHSLNQSSNLQLSRNDTSALSDKNNEAAMKFGNNSSALSNLHLAISPEDRKLLTTGRGKNRNGHDPEDPSSSSSDRMQMLRGGDSGSREDQMHMSGLLGNVQLRGGTSKNNNSIPNLSRSNIMLNKTNNSDLLQPNVGEVGNFDFSDANLGTNLFDHNDQSLNLDLNNSGQEHDIEMNFGNIDDPVFQNNNSSSQESSDSRLNKKRSSKFSIAFSDSRSKLSWEKRIVSTWKTIQKSAKKTGRKSENDSDFVDFENEFEFPEVGGSGLQEESKNGEEQEKKFEYTTFDQMPGIDSAADAALAFLDLLTLASCGEVNVSQMESYGVIGIQIVKQ
ncbi:unnamed protein product [Amoebophrya sp. A120]|nr:unnamed protein product [Amoebophrya sp. A120]|eukprot:GSA120T00008650001.1